MRAATRLAATGLMAVALTGCAAHHAATRQGDRFARAGAWEQAVGAYEQASLLQPESERIERRLTAAGVALERTRAEQLERAGRDLAAAVTRGDWAAAEDAVARARRADPEGRAAAALADDAIAALAASARGLAASGRAADAYVLALLGARIAPEHVAGRALLAERRGALLDEARTLARAERFEEAIARVRVVADREPAHAPPSLIAGLRADHAGSLAARAKRAEAAGHLAEAAIRFDQALRVDGEEGWRVERDRLVRAAADAQRYTVRWDPRGEPVADAVRDAALRALSQDPALRLVGAGGDARVDLTVAPQRCVDARVDETATTPVQTGTRDVPNPAHADATARAERAADAADTARWHRDRAAADLAAAERHLTALLTHDLPAARADLERAEEDVSRARRRAEEARDALAVARAAAPTDPLGQPVDDPILRRLEAELAAAERRLAEAEARAAPIREAHARAAAAVADAREAEAEARATVAEREEAVRRAERAGVEAERVLARTAPTLVEPVFEPFSYPVERWTRTCTHTATVRWREGGRDLRSELVDTRVTRDTRHAAWPEAGVVEDPLRWPEEDASQRALAEAAFADALARRVAEAARAAHLAEWRAAAAAVATDPDAAANTFLAVMAIAPAVADEAGPDLLVDRYGATDLRWVAAR